MGHPPPKTIKIAVSPDGWVHLGYCAICGAVILLATENLHREWHAGTASAGRK